MNKPPRKPTKTNALVVKVVTLLIEGEREVTHRATPGGRLDSHDWWYSCRWSMEEKIIIETELFKS